ncbi:hypothetical protein FOZG_15937 [Fusarium oxysporum Fo47]|uniref:Uncharacterized protein n=1 Tax=Fusarium oxysporum Fo47 TaxID=660027 RepID=W9JIZ7_FUSOX|nr:hypothetical protein FOZG_15937 [Fusarium oxysporum Fo47]
MKFKVTRVESRPTASNAPEHNWVAQSDDEQPQRFVDFRRKAETLATRPADELGCPDLSFSIPSPKFDEILSDADEVEDSTTTGIVPNRGVKRGRLSSSSLMTVLPENKKKWQLGDRAAKERRNADDGEYKGVDESRPAKRAQPHECIRPSVVPRGLRFGWAGLTDERV